MFRKFIVSVALAGVASIGLGAASASAVPRDTSPCMNQPELGVLVPCVKRTWHPSKSHHRHYATTKFGRR